MFLTYLVFAQIPYEKGRVFRVPFYFSMHLGNGVVVLQLEILRVVVSLVPPNDELSLSHVELSLVVAHQLGKSCLPLYELAVRFNCLLYRDSISRGSMIYWEGVLGGRRSSLHGAHLHEGAHRK